MRLVNLDQVIRGHEKFLAENERLVREETNRAGKHALNHVRQYPLFTPRTGKLQKRTTARVVKIGRNFRLKIDNKLPYADAIDGGAKPHPIRARNAPYLVFKTRDGKWIRTKSVNHPGNKPYKFAYRATQSANRVLGQSLERRMQLAAKHF